MPAEREKRNLLPDSSQFGRGSSGAVTFGVNAHKATSGPGDRLVTRIWLLGWWHLMSEIWLTVSSWLGAPCADEL